MQGPMKALSYITPELKVIHIIHAVKLHLNNLIHTLYTGPVLPARSAGLSAQQRTDKNSRLVAL